MSKRTAFYIPVLALLSLFILSTPLNSYSQVKYQLKGSVERIKVHGKGLEGNLEGDSVDRYVSIYLPPGYKSKTKRRYPVVYFLHGYTDDDAKWYGLQKHWINMPVIIDSLFAGGKANEMIIVTPNAYTRYQGSMYSNSVTTGNWEDYVAKELVAYIDAHYRTIPTAASRGLAGHSMGGYGTLRISEKHPEIFSSIYLLSPCCLMSSNPNTQIPPSFTKAEGIKTFEEFEKTDFTTKILFASAAAWSPNPNASPFYLDLPYKNGQVQQDVLAKWFANMPLTNQKDITNLRRLHAIAFDAGTKDESIAMSIKVLDSVLTKRGINHTFEIYEGTHTSRIAQRIEQKMVSFFSNNLSFKQP
jgi:S-formylglutathione hydrolase